MNESKPTSPYSIRFTDEERTYIRKMAQSLELKDAAFIRLKIFADCQDPKISVAHSNEALDKKTLARLLAALGNSEHSKNLRQILELVEMGETNFSTEEKQLLQDACYASISLHSTLLKSLGVRP